MRGDNIQNSLVKILKLNIRSLCTVRLVLLQNDYCVNIAGRLCYLKDIVHTKHLGTFILYLTKKVCYQGICGVS